MPAPGESRRQRLAAAIAVALVLGVASLPAPSLAQHTKLSLESIGPDGGGAGQNADLVGAVNVGQRAFIRTAEPLVAADTDSSIDLYERTGSGTALISTGPAGGNGPFAANFGAAVDGGETVYFQTLERLSPADTDDFLDVYRRHAGTTTLVSVGPAGGNGPHDAHFAGASQDGSRVFFTTREALVASDTDSSIDIYERSGGTTTLISTGPAGGNGDPAVQFRGNSPDGQRVWFETPESLVAADTDTAVDVYERFNGTTTLVSTGPTASNTNHDANLAGASADGSRLFFGTAESLVPEDIDTRRDVYERSGGVTTLRSPGNEDTPDANAELVGLSETGSRVFFHTTERISPDDRDAVIDVYEHSGGTVTLLTPGANGNNGAANAYFVGASSDGARVFFRTPERIIASDTDAHQDVYMAEGGVVTLLSTGPAGGNGPADAYFAGASADGQRVFIETVESLVASDTDSHMDVYEVHDGTTSLLSTGATGGNGPYDAFFRGLSADGNRVFFRTEEALVPADTDLTPDVYSANVPGTVNVEVDAVPDHAQDFSFTAIGLEPGGFDFGPLSFDPTTFQLDDDADPALSNTQTFTQVTPGVGYSVSQATPAGWDLAAASCDDGSPVGNIDVGAAEEVTCTFTNHKRGRIVVNLDAVPNDGQDFSFTAGGGLSPESFSLDDDSDGTLPNTFTFNDVPAGSGYSLSQSLPAGWDQASATCSNGSPVSDIALSPDETVTCTFTNHKRGQIVVVKDAQPDHPQDFAFTAGGGLSPTSFLLDDDSDDTLSNTRTFENVAPGSGYSLSESVPSGWSLAATLCSNGSHVSNITVYPGQTVTCVFVNVQRGQIVVVKDAQPDDPQDFSFTAGGGLSPASFTLDDDSDPTLSNTHTFSDVPAGSGYSLAESVPSGWDQGSATCDNGSPVSNISVSAGETVTCTFENRKRGQIVVVKDAVPNHPQDFAFTAGGGLSPTSFTLDDDNNPQLSNTLTFNDVVARDGYSISETVPSGWTQASATCSNGSPVSNIDVNPGQTVTCTFVNHRDGSLTILKDAVPNDPQDFEFTVGGGLTPANFSLDDDSDDTLSNTHTYASVPTGVYSASETVPAGWDQTSATCSDGSPVTAIDIGPNEKVTCTFVNRKRGRIIAMLDTQPDDPQDFSFTAGGGLLPTSFSLDDDSDPTLSNTHEFDDLVPGGGYSLAAESVPSTWFLAGATCDNGSPVSNIDVSPGEVVTCTFSIQKRGRIVVVKDSTPDDPQDFVFNAGGGLIPSTFQLDDDSDPALSNTHTFDDVAPGGGYSLSETVPSGWEQTGATCDDGSAPSNIVVDPGETVTCTFSNRKLGKLVVVKDAIPDDPQDFSFTAGGGLSPTSFTLDDDSDPALSNTHTFDGVTPASGYSIAESVPTGWIQVSATCDDGSPTSDIDVAAGETVTCTFVNSRGYPRPRGATPLRMPLTVAYAECTSPNRSHAPPLDSPSCNPPVQASSYLTVGTPDANSRSVNMVGSVRLAVVSGNPGTVADEADVNIQTRVSDVFVKAGLTDYTGQLEARLSLRVTDRLNGPAQNEPGTTTDVPFSFAVPCSATEGSAGATCDLITSADALLAGAVVESKRTIWQLGDVELFDGGADGVASTQDNTLFARQGVFIP